MSAIDDKLARLDELLQELGSVLVCYSGGVDSAFILAAAHRVLGPRAVGMTAVSPSLAPSELDDARRVATTIGADHRVVESQEIHDPNYQANAPDRCFHCKSELYRIAEDRRRAWSLAAVVNGTNVDDLGDYRPGLAAAKNASVRSPFVELGFTKEDVREGARRLGLEVWDKPAAACLSSRIPFGTRVTPERLAQIGSFEAALRGLGFRRVRVRFHPAGSNGDQAFARIELDPSDIARASSDELREAIVEAGVKSGFLYVTIDLRGYRMGSHNETLPSKGRGPSLPVVR
ncbi:MAG: ATP-dependent sacrificial sulfur transferase LarE [Polyangiaceae bacterium]|nr:ATP-dependent sacrificial sulfur transferase LarE [Polyangiaceae bacterium]